jgi:hypothetical protein
MKEKLQIRLKTLQVEFDAGKTVMAELEAKQASTRNTLLRISGAIQVLEEVLSEENAGQREVGRSANGAAPVSTHVG